jgi:hypothetical protein
VIEFAGNYGQSLDWIVLGDLDLTISRLRDRARSRRSGGDGGVRPR